MEIDVEYLRAGRKARGMSQTDVAKALGLSESTISNVETGRTRLLYGNASEAIARLLSRWRAEDARGFRVQEEGPAVIYTSYQCKHCWHMTPGPEQGAHVCMVCGQPVGPTCPTCRAAVAVTDRFCGSCGHVLREDEEGDEAE